MRIFTAIRHSHDPRFFYGALWRSNFYPALRQLGHDVIESNTDLLPTSRFMDVAGKFTREELEARARTTEQLLTELHKAHRQAPVELFLSYFYNAHFDPAGFDEIRKLGIPSINFYCNSIYQFGLVDAVAAKADYAWHTERDARNLYLKAGANPIWVQMGGDAQIYRPIPDTIRQNKACFIGQRYSDRAQWAAALLTRGIPFELFGSGWGSTNAANGSTAPEATQYLGRSRPTPGTAASYVRAVREELRLRGWSHATGRLFRQWRHRRASQRLTPLFASAFQGRADDVAHTFARFEVVLNFSNVWSDGRPGSSLIPHVRLRDFEGPLCRTCYLTGHSDEIGEFYEIGKEIDTYRTEAELVDKVGFYLRTPASAQQLREAGYMRAVRDHTWVRRFDELFRKTGLVRNAPTYA